MILFEPLQPAKKAPFFSRDAQLLFHARLIFPPLRKIFCNRTLHFITFSISESASDHKVALSWLLRISVRKKSAHESSTSSFSWQSKNQRGGVKTGSFLILERI